MKAIEKTFKIILNTVLVVFILLGVLIVFSSVPFPGNYKAFIVKSGSMEPTIHTGSIVFVRPEESYAVGEIVTRRTTDPSFTVTHRLFSQKEKNGQVVFDTKGDANDTSDHVDIAKSDIVGKVVWSVPFAGYVVNYAKTPQGMLILIIVPAIIIIYDEARKIKKEIKLKLDYNRRVKKRRENNFEDDVQEAQEKI